MAGSDDERDPEDLDLPSSTKKDVASVNSALATSISLWLRKHGKSVRPKLSEEQKQQLKECFELMDQDGSGAIDADELGAAFKLLGIRMKRQELEALLAEVDHDGSGEVEYLEFLEIMTSTLQRLAEEREADDSGKNEGQVPFALMATAYRRKRLMEGIISGDREVQAQIMQLSEKQAAEAAAAAQAMNNGKSKGGANGSGKDGDGAKSKGASAFTKRALQRLAQMNLDEELLASLSPDEQRLLNQVVVKAQTSHGAGARSPSPSPVARAAAASSSGARAGLAPTRSPGGVGRSSGAASPILGGPPKGHYTQSATHQQLMETPQVFELKFSRSIINVNGARGSRGSPLPLPSKAASAGIDGSRS